MKGPKPSTKHKTSKWAINTKNNQFPFPSPQPNHLVLPLPQTQNQILRTNHQNEANPRTKTAKEAETKNDQALIPNTPSIPIMISNEFSNDLIIHKLNHRI